MLGQSKFIKRKKTVRKKVTLEQSTSKEALPKACIQCKTDLLSVGCSIPGMEEVLKFCPNPKCYRYGLVTGLVLVRPNSLETKEQEG